MVASTSSRARASDAPSGRIASATRSTVPRRAPGAFCRWTTLPFAGKRNDSVASGRGTPSGRTTSETTKRFSPTESEGVFSLRSPRAGKSRASSRTGAVGEIGHHEGDADGRLVAVDVDAAHLAALVHEPGGAIGEARVAAVRAHALEQELDELVLAAREMRDAARPRAMQPCERERRARRPRGRRRSAPAS